MGKRDRLWKKLWVLALCGVMAMEPAVACAEESAEAMNAADAQADVSMELPEEVENDIVEEMDEAVAEIPSEAGTESGKRMQRHQTLMRRQKQIRKEAAPEKLWHLTTILVWR